MIKISLVTDQGIRVQLSICSIGIIICKYLTSNTYMEVFRAVICIDAIYYRTSNQRNTFRI
jgi:hypothetical protein